MHSCVKQVDIRSIKIYYMADDGGSALTDGVSRDIKAAIQKVAQYMKSTHGIAATKVRPNYLFEYVCSSKLKRQDK
jgi:hypothetical protein